MKLLVRSLWLGLLVWVSSGCKHFEPPHVQVEQYEGRKIRVACVGDSITYGAGVEGRETNNYPAVLGAMLGGSFEVRNYGRSGATLSKAGDLPYWTTDEFRASTAWVPDVVILKLGTNDTKPQNWKGRPPFEQDLVAILQHFQNLPHKPRTKIWVCVPVPVYETKWGINREVMDTGVVPAIMDTCQKHSVPVIDLNDALSGHPDLFPDKIHPNAAGARLMALTIYQAIRP
jgi:lysophospholipase L1-like esterase